METVGLSLAAFVGQLGLTAVIILLIGLGAGFLFDRLLGTGTTITMLCLVCGVPTSIVMMVMGVWGVARPLQLRILNHEDDDDV